MAHNSGLCNFLNKIMKNYLLEVIYKVGCCIPADSEKEAREIIKDQFKEDNNIELTDEEIKRI